MYLRDAWGEHTNPAASWRWGSLETGTSQDALLMPCVAIRVVQGLLASVAGHCDDHTDGVLGGWVCCASCGRFALGLLRFGRLLALLICTTKKARATMAPRKAKTGMVWPTSWL